MRTLGGEKTLKEYIRINHRLKNLIWVLNYFLGHEITQKNVPGVKTFPVGEHILLKTNMSL